MKDLMKRTTFYFYFRVTEYGFYSDAEKERILKLISLANGYDESEIEELFDTVVRIEEDKINDPVSCKNYLLVANFLPDVSQTELEAVQALNEFYEKYRVTELYSGRSSWCRAMFKTSNHLERGFFEYASKRPNKAITYFECAMKNENEDWPIPEMLAIVCTEANDYKKALRYAIEAQWIDNSTKVDIPWISHIEENAKSVLSIAEYMEIENRAQSNKNCSCKIGFVS